MKKTLFYLLPIFLIAAMCVGLASCGDSDPVPDPTPTPTPTPQPDPQPIDDTSNPFTIEAIGSGTITFKNRATGSVIYKVDGGAAQTITSGRICQIPVSAGQKIMFFGNNATYWPDEEASNISGTTDFYAYGNIMSLISSTNYRSLKSLNGDYAFASLFHGATHLRSHSTKPLTLPATKLSYGCYYGMFQGCSNLTTAPVLPAQTLSEGCYENMFSGCTRLNYVKCMAEGTVDGFIYTADWLEDVSSSGTFVKASGSSWSSGISGIPRGWTVVDNNGQEEQDDDNDDNNENEEITYPDIRSTPLTLEAIADGTITFRNKASGSVTYKIDGGEEQTIGAGRTTNISVAAGQKVRFFGNNATYYDNYSFDNSNVSSTADFYAYGNIMSLVSSTDYTNATTLTKDYVFYGFFDSNTGLKSHPSKPLVLPATTLTSYCYRNMFNGCTGLTKAPALPATTLAKQCYCHMFHGCTSLTSAPVLPATTLAESCYAYMFRYCTGLTSAQKLPAMTLVKDCYAGMFDGCKNLASAPELPATTLADKCYYVMFEDCKSLTSAPELPATTLVDNCYYRMFYGCTSLNYVKCMAEDISANNCTKEWLKNVAADGTFEPVIGTNWPDGPSGTPIGWTTSYVLGD